ncbi:MAG: flavin reductase family protein [Ruminococcaceae bacterium]|nr:flavin reductase family protein [Oscillospiraceae bacterium]
MFKEISAKDVKDNLIKAIADEWMLISAGDENGYNMMTASWGFAGEMWGNDSVIAMVRPQRYTMEFIDKNDYFTLSFYGDNKEIHKICGSKSGRDVDKTALAGLTPVFSDGTVYFEEARLIFICKKQYVGKLEQQNFTDNEPLHWYNDDFHNIIIGKIEKVLVK